MALMDTARRAARKLNRVVMGPVRSAIQQLEAQVRGLDVLLEQVGAHIGTTTTALR
jgi:hypothetical protein